MKNFEHEFSGVAREAYRNAVSLTEDGCRELIRAFHHEGLDARTKVKRQRLSCPDTLFSRIIETVASCPHDTDCPYALEWFGVVLKAFLDNGFRFLGNDSYRGAQAMLQLLSMEDSYVRTLFVKSFLAMGEMPHVAVYDDDRTEGVSSYGFVKVGAIKAYAERDWDRGDPAHWLEDFRLMRAAWRSEDFTGIKRFHLPLESSRSDLDTRVNAVLWIPEGQEKPRIEDGASQRSRVVPFLGAIRLCCSAFDVVLTSKAEAMIDPTMKRGMYGEEVDVSEAFREFLGHRIVEAFPFVYQESDDRGFSLAFETEQTLRFRENREESTLWKRLFIDEHYGERT